jgi:uncharacterized membrane protein
METPSAIYQIMLLLHVITAIVGFGGVIMHGAYNARAFRSPAAEAAVTLKATASVTNIAHYAIYATFAFGIVLIAVSDGEIGFGEPWISGAFLVWFILVGLAHGLVRPAVKGLTARAEALPADTVLSTDTEAGALAKKLALGEGLTQLFLVVALVLMVWQPGN